LRKTATTVETLNADMNSTISDICKNINVINVRYEHSNALDINCEEKNSIRPIFCLLVYLQACKWSRCKYYCSLFARTFY